MTLKVKPTFLKFKKRMNLEFNRSLNLTVYKKVLKGFRFIH